MAQLVLDYLEVLEVQLLRILVVLDHLEGQLYLADQLVLQILENRLDQPVLLYPVVQADLAGQELHLLLHLLGYLEDLVDR
jgi:hypothetical protein